MCPPIGASFKESRYLLRSPRLCGLHHMARKEERSRSLLVKEQRTMSSLFSPLRCERLQFALCNLTRRETRPVTQLQEGRLTLRLLSRRSTLTQPPHALIFHLFLICALLLFPTLIPLSLCSCCLSFDPSLIPHDCAIIREQTRRTALLVFVRRSWLSYVSAGPGLTASELVHMLTFVSGTGRTSKTTLELLRELKVHKGMSR